MYMLYCMLSIVCSICDVQVSLTGSFPPLGVRGKGAYSVELTRKVSIPELMEVDSEMLCISDVPETIGYVQHNIRTMNRPLSQTFKETITVYSRLLRRSTIICIEKKNSFVFDTGHSKYF